MCTSKATEVYRKTRAYQCCSKGQVPPKDVTSCSNQSNAPSPDMSFSNFDCDNRGGFDCGCETLNSDNASTYNQICNDDNWSSDSNNDNSSDSNNDDPSGGSSDSEPGSSDSPGSDSSGPGDSSNSSGPGGGSSDSSGPGGPGDEGDGDLEYDYRDSLHKIISNTTSSKKNLDAILLCMIEPINCDGMKQKDTLVRNAILDASNTNDTNFAAVRLRLLMTDTMLSHHLDSVVKHQRENLDSVLMGMSKGFVKVDSLIDSAVKYFQISNHYDSVYRVMFRDFEDGLTDEFSDLPGRNASAIGDALGYGDTSTFNLRGDLMGIKDAIEGLGDGLGGDIAGALDSAWGNGTAAEGSGFEDYGSDSAGYIGVLGSYYSEGTSVDSAYLVDGDTCTSVDCIVSNVNYNIDSMGRAFRASVDTQYQSLSDSSSVWFDSIKKNLMFVNFDSVLVDPLRQRIPNTNACPENCFFF